jgi:hypothetical protein
LPLSPFLFLSHWKSSPSLFSKMVSIVAEMAVHTIATSSRSLVLSSARFLA